MVPLSPATWVKVTLIFSQENRDLVRRWLEEECADALPFCDGKDGVALERIRFAVLKLSAGDVKALRREIEQAKRDWRDTLVDAGFGHDLTAHERWLPGPPG